MSVVTQGELLAGVECMPDGRRKIELRQFYEQIIGSTQQIVPITPTVAERYAAVLAQLRRAGRPIVTNDIWIGATALVHGLVLVTNDAHFGYINGLRVEDWTVSHNA
jgi:predicted nucleic acid-binding protein